MFSERINVVIPLFNDWEAVSLLIERIKLVLDASLQRRLHFLLVDDCSTIDYASLPTNVGESLSILRLYRNVGHQKAIVLGLAYLASKTETFPTIVMDSDGEDLPEDIVKLIHVGTDNPGSIIFAHRSKRHESLTFRLFYIFYKTAFRLLTGKVITFGNFSFIPASQLKKLTHVSETWNNYPGGVIRSKLPYADVPIERGRRLAGESKMKFVSLILHGLSAVSVLMDTAAVRLVLFCVVMISASAVGIAVIAFFRLFTSTAVPGWAIYLATLLFIIILQALLISLLLVFIVLSTRTQAQFIPAKQFQDFIERVEKIK